jgi:excisionase family DNA binding protein
MVKQREVTSIVMDWRDRAALKRLEACRVIGISPSTLDRRIRERAIRATKVGGVVLVPVDEIERIIGAPLAGEASR